MFFPFKAIPFCDHMLHIQSGEHSTVLWCNAETVNDERQFYDCFFYNECIPILERVECNDRVARTYK